MLETNHIMKPKKSQRKKKIRQDIIVTSVQIIVQLQQLLSFSARSHYWKMLQLIVRKKKYSHKKMNRFAIQMECHCQTRSYPSRSMISFTTAQ